MRAPTVLSVALAATMAAQALLGLLLTDSYRDVAWITASWFGNDWVTLVAAAPLLTVASATAGSGSTRGLLVWLGVLAYAVYNYAFYLYGAALNVFFPLYVAGVVLAAAAMLMALARVDPTRVAAGFSRSTPVRLIGGYFAFVGAALAAVWLTLWARYAFAGQPPPVDPEAFKLVAAMDLTLVSTPLVVGGIRLWRRSPWGYVMAPIAGVQSTLYLVVLAVNAAIAVRRGLVEAPGELPLWAALAALTSAITVCLFAQIGRSSLVRAFRLRD